MPKLNLAKDEYLDMLKNVMKNSLEMFHELNQGVLKETSLEINEKGGEFDFYSILRLSLITQITQIVRCFISIILF